MPYLNAGGRIAHGVAGAGAYVDNAWIDAGGDTCWLDAETVVYQHLGNDGAYVALCNLSNGEIRRAIAEPSDPYYGLGSNTLRAGGGVWAAWLSGRGLYAGTGFAKPDAGLLAVGDGGEIIYIDVYAQGGPVRVRERDGADWLLFAGSVLDADGYGNGRAVFTDYANALHVFGMPAPALIPGPVYRPRAAFVGGEWWLSYFSAAGCVVHPFASTIGYRIGPPGDCWQDVSARDGDAGALGVAYATTQGEALVYGEAIDVASAPRVQLVPDAPPIEPPVIPPIVPEIETMKPPIVTVDSWTLDQVDDGKEFRFHDDGNPEHQIAVRVWVAGGSMHAEISNSAGSAATGARRDVKPCAAVTPPEPIDPPIPPEPPAADTFTLQRMDGKFLCVGRDAYLTQRGKPAQFETVALDDGTVGLKANGHFCAAEEDCRVRADRPDAGPWERWHIEKAPEPNALSFASHAGMYLCAQDDGAVLADRFEIGAWEKFFRDPPAPAGLVLHGRLRIDGRMLRDDSDYYRPVWSDALAILTREHEPFLDWVLAMGFNGCRVFCGDLPWANQTPAAALAALPAFLAAARARGLRVEATALTGTESGYDARAYVADAAGICDGYDNAILEMANEPWHPTQKDLTPDFLMSCQSSVPAAVISALGAAESDESSEYAGGPYITAHLDRSRDEWNMVRRVRELEALSVNNGKPVLNNEPIKAGSQNSNPAIFFTMAVLNRGFEVGGVFHSDDGLEGRVPAPGSQQQTLAEAYIRGSRVITTRERMTYKNAGWHDSPVKEFTGAVRVYSFMADQNVAVALGIEVPGVTEGSFSITTQNGWRLGPVLDEMPNVRVYQLVQ